MKKQGVIGLGILAVFILVFGNYFLEYAKNPLTPGYGLYPTLNETEKALVMIINKSLERALIDGEIIGTSYPDQSQPVVLSTRNIDPYWVLPVEGWDVEVLSIYEIKNEYEGVYINGEKSRLWVRFNKIESRGDDLTFVEMGLMYGEGASGWGVSSWGLEIYFRKTPDQGWIIQSSYVMVI